MPRQYTPRSANKDLKGRFVTVAFDEKTRFLIEIAARNERRTVSSIINEAVLDYVPRLSHVEFNFPTPLSSIVEEIWSPIASTRFVLHADRLPSTLTFEEQILWQLIQKDAELWRTLPNGEEVSRDGNAKNGIKHDLLREKWEQLKERAARIAEDESVQSIAKPALRARIDTSVPTSILQGESRKRGKK
jgi:hypothetical protein